MLLRLRPQFLQNSSTVLEAAFAFHVLERVALDLFVGGFLLEYTCQDLIRRVGANSVDDRKGKFAFGEIFAKALEGCVARGRREIEVVVEDLEEQSYCGDEGCAVPRVKSVWRRIPARAEEAW